MFDVKSNAATSTRSVDDTFDSSADRIDRRRGDERAADETAATASIDTAKTEH
jgi:hypothetical protein